MTGPASGAHDPRILRHPEYTRSYHLYLGQGAPPDEAARLAYDWTRRSIPAFASGPGKTNHVAIGAVIAAIAAIGLCGIVAVSNDEGQDTARAADAITSSPEPPSSSTTGDPTPSGSLSATPTTAPPAPGTAVHAPTIGAPPPATGQPQPAATAPRRPPPTGAAPQPACNPAYPDVCLKDGIGDYDCAGGTGNGPNYVREPIRVLPPDPFDLDRNGDGTGCEQ